MIQIDAEKYPALAGALPFLSKAVCLDLEKWLEGQTNKSLAFNQLIEEARATIQRTAQQLSSEWMKEVAPAAASASEPKVWFGLSDVKLLIRLELLEAAADGRLRECYADLGKRYKIPGKNPHRVLGGMVASLKRRGYRSTFLLDVVTNLPQEHRQAALQRMAELYEKWCVTIPAEEITAIRQFCC